MTHPFRVGDRVCYRATFLRSCGWYTDVPDAGTVTEIKQLRNSDTVLVKVEWDGFEDIGSGYVNGANLILSSRRHLEAP